MGHRLLPTINQMSILGLISLPGLMTGAILGGQSVEQAAKMQMVRPSHPHLHKHH
jgi:ABC-type iron transport system FetAB permease component